MSEAGAYRAGKSCLLLLTFLGPYLGSVIFWNLPKPGMPLGVYFRALLMVMGPSYILGFIPALATAILFHIIDRFASSALSRPITALAVGSAFSFAMGALLFRNAQAPTFAPHTRIFEVSVLILETTISGGAPAFLIVYFRKTHPLDWPRWLRTILGVRAPSPEVDGEEF